MNTKSVFLAVLLVALGASSALAGNTFQIGAGLAVPNGDLGDGWKKGLGFDGTFLAEVSPTFSLGGNIGYHGFGFDDDLLAADETSDGGKFSALNFCVEGRLHTGAMDKGRFWGCAGVGYYVLSLSDLTVTGPGGSTVVWQNLDSETKFGGYFGAGAATPMGPTMAIGVEAKYHTILEEFGVNSESISFFEVKVAAVFMM